MSIYQGPNIIRDSIVLYLDAANIKSYPITGNTWYDLSGYENNGTLLSGATYNNSYGGIMQFDGVSATVDCGNNSSLQLIRGTISSWINTAGGSLWKGILTKQYAYGLFTSDNYLAAYDWGNGTGRVTTYNITNSWCNVALAFTDITGSPVNNAIIYLNGSPVLTCTIKITDNLTSVQLASGHWVLQYAQCNISRCYIYNRVLSQTELQQNFNALKSKFGL